MYIRRLFAKLTNLVRHGHAEAEMNCEVSVLQDDLRQNHERISL